MFLLQPLLLILRNFHPKRTCQTPGYHLNAVIIVNFVQGAPVQEVAL